MSHVFYKLKLCASKNTLQLAKINTNVMRMSKKCISQHKLCPNFTKQVNYVKKNVHVRRINIENYSTSTTDQYIIMEDILMHEQGELKTVFEEKENLRYYLYPDKRDQIIDQIFNSTSAQDVFDVIKEYKDLKYYHVCQSVLSLWELQRAYNNCFLLNLDKQDVDLEGMLSDYTDKIQLHPEFQTLLNLVVEHSPSFNPLELSCTLFNLNKMGLMLNHPVLDHLVELTRDSIRNDSGKWCLKSLSFYTSTFESKDSLRSVYLTKDLLPYYMKAIETSKTILEFELVTIGLYNIHILLSKSILTDYISKLKELVNEDKITKDHLKLLIKALAFFNLPHWSRENSHHIQYFSSFFKSHVDQLNVSELLILHTICQIQSSPGYLREEIKNSATRFLNCSSGDNRISTFMKLPELILCQVTASSLDLKTSLETTIQECIQHSLPSMLVVIYKLLRHLKYSNTNMSDMFWTKVMDSMADKNLSDYILLRLMFRYMHFNNNLGDSYRCYKFEEVMIKKCLDLKDSYIVHIPWKLTRIVSFVVAFGLDRRKLVNFDVAHNLVSRLDQMKDQLSSLDLLILSRGLNLTNLKHHRRTNTRNDIILNKVDRILNDVAIKNLNSENNLSLDELCCNVRVFHYRQTRLDSEEYLKTIYKMEKSEDTLSARQIREILINLFPSDFILPKMFDRICNYIAECGHNLYGEIVFKVLYTFYQLGYVPQNMDFYAAVIGVIERDKDVMNCLSLLQTCLALCYFGQLPQNIVKLIFSIEFMEKIDKEIESCYSKIKYPYRVRQSLMLLNRAVCLELPEYDVPWFHEKYLAGKKSLTPVIKPFIYDEVLSILVKILGSKDAIRLHHYSPYGYKIDFFAQLDRRNKPIAQSLQTAPSVKDVAKTKIAISLINANTFSKYCDIPEDSSNFFRLKLVPNGILSSRRRHLELMGYRIIDIHPSLWNSMHMAEPNEKFKYLQKKIFKTS